MEYITKQQAYDAATDAYNKSEASWEFYRLFDSNIKYASSFHGIGAVLCSECKYLKESYVTITFGPTEVCGGPVKFCTRGGDLEQIPEWCDWCSAGEKKAGE